MNDLRKLLTGVAVAGLLVGGAGPAAAGGDGGHGGNYWHHSDDKIKVVVVKYHKDRKKDVKYETLSLKEAVKYAKKRCDDKSWEDLWKEAKDTEKHNLKWNEVCWYDHEHNKHVEYELVFKDAGK